MSDVSNESTKIPATIPAKTISSDSHSVQITTIRLNGDNFLRWSQSVRMYMKGRGKMGYLTGEKKAPAEEDSAYEVWDAENSMIMAWLVNSMEEEISSNYMCYPMAKELWENVVQMYSDFENQSQIFELNIKLGEIRQGDDTVTKYFNSLKRIWQDLDLFDTYEWKSVEDGKHHKNTIERTQIYKFLAGLKVEFDEVRGRIIGRQPLPPIGEVFSEVRREESRRMVMLGKKGLGAALEGSALATMGAGYRRNTPYSQKSDEKPRVWCDFCNKPRHTRETCWKIHGKPANWKSKAEKERLNFTPAAHEADSSPFTKEQMDHLHALLNTAPTSSSSGIPTASIAYAGNKILEINALNCSLQSSTPWIIDSGASDHMTNSSKFFESYLPCPGNQKVRIADGNFSPIAGKGLIKISEGIDLKSVLHVPKLTCNLLSVSKLSRDSNCCVIFYDSHCLFQDQKSGKTIGNARMINGLYYFKDKTSDNKIAQGLSSISSVSVHDQIMVWHYRLGHPSFSYLKYLFPTLFKGVNPLSFQCESCLLAKSHRKPYVKSFYQSSKPFYLFHSDVWGPSKITTNSGKKWFVTFIDDHTRLCWVYLMKEKSEVAEIFTDFYSMIETQFQTKISILRSDNGTEYFNKILGSFLSRKGILHQSSCPDNPEQNGLAERKNKHLLEVARAMMFYMNMPKYLWGDAVLTASYLINRMPTRVLQYTTPLSCFKKIFPSSRVYSELPLKNFGCTAYVHIPKGLGLNLSQELKNVFFLGIPLIKKGTSVSILLQKKFIFQWMFLSWKLLHIFRKI